MMDTTIITIGKTRIHISMRTRMMVFQRTIMPVYRRKAMAGMTTICGPRICMY